MNGQPEIDLTKLTQPQLTKLAEGLLRAHKTEHEKGTYERTAYEAAIGLLMRGPGQHMGKRLVGRVKGAVNERRLRRLQDKEPDGAP